MERRNKWFSMSLAVAGTLLFTIGASAQGDLGCNSCGSDGYGYAAGSCATGDCNAVGGIGSRLHRGGSGFFHNVKSHYDHLCDVNRKAFERNRAWPKPFDCADRQLYFSIWDQMLTHGYQLNCVFDSSHFNPNTNELNTAGITKLRSIFLNNPVGQKVAYVQNSGTADIVEARLNNLQSSVAQWYGTESFTEIAATNVSPSIFTGQRVEMLQGLGNSKLAAPVIPVASGTGSTTSGTN